MTTLFAQRRTQAPDTLGNPFPGARPFKPKEHDIFFGRSSETSALGALVRSQPLVLLYAPSGAGKSSLINAGLLHELGTSADRIGDGSAIEAGTFDVVGVANVHPGAVPHEDGWPDKQEVPNVYVKAALDSLEDGDASRHTTIAGYLEARKRYEDEFGDRVPRLIVFDQFEEILEPFDREDWLDCRDDFIEQLDRALQDDPSLHVLVGIREDHLATIERLLASMSAPLRARYRMDRLAADEAERVIEKATTASGVPITQEALNALVSGLGQRHLAGASKPSWLHRIFEKLLRRRRGTPPRSVPDEFVDPGLLSVVGRRLWRSAVTKPKKAEDGSEKLEITMGDVDGLGGVDGALQKYYDDAIKDVATGRTQMRLRRFFEHRLISGHGTRQLVPWDPDSRRSNRIRNSTILQLRDKYGLLRTEYRGGANYVELSHDGFIQPVQNANQLVRRRRRRRRNIGIATLMATGGLVIAYSWFYAGDTEESEPAEQTPLVALPVELPTTPDVVGLTRQQAEEVAEDVGIRVDFQEIRSPAPVGQVVEQSPTASEPASNMVATVSAGRGIIARDDQVLVAPGDDTQEVEVLLNDEPSEPGEELRLESVDESRGVIARAVGNRIAVSAPNPGTFEVAYTVVGPRERSSATLVVNAVPVEARATPSESDIVAGSSVEFVDESTGVDVTNVWTLPDGSTTPGEPSVIHQFESAGDFVVRLEVTDRAGNTDTDLVEISVENGPRTVTFVAQDVFLRAGPTIDEPATSSIQGVTGTQLQVHPTPQNGWYRIVSGEHSNEWVFGALVVPQDGALQVGETLTGEPAVLVDQAGEPTGVGNPSGRLVLVEGVEGERYQVRLPDGSIAWVNVAEIRILVQSRVETLSDPVG